MKAFILILALAAAAAPAFAMTQCTSYQGRTICCTTTGNFTSCY